MAVVAVVVVVEAVGGEGVLSVHARAVCAVGVLE